MLTCEGTVNSSDKLVKWRGSLSLLEIYDGTSNTFMFGERHVPYDHFGDNIGDGSIYNGDHHRTAGRVAGPGSPGSDYNHDYDFNIAQDLHDVAHGPERWERIFGSWHPASCNFAFADGSVHTLSVSTDVIALQRLANRKDRKQVPDF